MAMRNKQRQRLNSSDGFTLMEVMVATVLLVIGIVALLGVLTYGFSTVQTSQYDILAKNEAREVLEAIYAARSSGQLNFDQINSTTAAPPGVFLTGFQNCKLAGPDGLFNTLDDTGMESLQVPSGPTIPFDFMQRQISFGTVLLQDGVTVDPDVRTVTITVQYQTGRFGAKTYQINSYISRYR